MPDSVNRPRQLLKLADLLREHGQTSVAEAIDKAATDEFGRLSPRLVDRLTLMIVRLPIQVRHQAQSVLGDTAEKYIPQLDRVIRHFGSNALAGSCQDWVSVFDQSATITIDALSDLVGLKLDVTPPRLAEASDLASSVLLLISQIQAAEELDGDTRAYLLEIAFHLQQILQRFDLFGIEDLLDLQGQFVTTLVNFHKDLVPTDADENTDSGRWFTRLLLDATEKAILITGLPANAFAIAEVVRLAIERGGKVGPDLLLISSSFFPTAELRSPTVGNG